MIHFYDTLETRSPQVREAELMQALPQQVAHARSASAAFAEILQDVDSATVTSRAALSRLPVTRKTDLHERQQAQRERDVFGGFSAVRFGAHMPRVLQSRSDL